MIHASPATIYRAFANMKALECWLPPEGMTGRILAFDFREGGSYRMILSYNEPDHSPGKTSKHTDEVEVRFLKLIAHERIEQEVAFNSENSQFSGAMKITWIFTAARAGTEVTVRCENVPVGIRPEAHEAGLMSSLENLARFAE